jgi:hypothetical protein
VYAAGLLKGILPDGYFHLFNSIGCCVNLAFFEPRNFSFNYYLTVKPDEFILALVLAAILLIGLMYLLLSLISGWFFSLPLVLFENIRPAKSLSISRQRTQSYRFKLIKWIACWVLIMHSLPAMESERFTVR